MNINDIPLPTESKAHNTKHRTVTFSQKKFNRLHVDALEECKFSDISRTGKSDINKELHKPDTGLFQAIMVAVSDNFSSVSKGIENSYSRSSSEGNSSLNKNGIKREDIEYMDGSSRKYVEDKRRSRSRKEVELKDSSNTEKKRRVVEYSPSSSSKSLNSHVSTSYSKEMEKMMVQEADKNIDKVITPASNVLDPETAARAADAYRRCLQSTLSIMSTAYKSAMATHSKSVPPFSFEQALLERELNIPPPPPPPPLPPPPPPPPLPRSPRTRSLTLETDKSCISSQQDEANRSIPDLSSVSRDSGDMQMTAYPTILPPKPVFPLPSLILPSGKELFVVATPSSYYNNCCCYFPSPDEWANGIKPCDGLSCTLAALKVSCNEKCPTEELCSNQQFRDLDACKDPTMGYAEFQFDVKLSKWKIIARVPLKISALVAGVGAELISCDNSHKLDFKENDDDEDQFVYVTPNLGFCTGQDNMIIDYINQSSDPNVVLEKWLVNGYVRLGIFAIKHIDRGDELLIDKTKLSQWCLYKDYFEVGSNPNLNYADGTGNENENENTTMILHTLRYLVHEFHFMLPLQIQCLTIRLGNSLPSVIADVRSFLRLGGVPTLLVCCDLLFLRADLERDLGDVGLIVSKIVSMLVSILNECNKGQQAQNNHVCHLGVNVLPCLKRIRQRVNPQPSYLFHYNRLKLLLEKHCVAKGQQQQALVKLSNSTSSPVVAPLLSSSIADQLHCRLPPFWCSRLTRATDSNSSNQNVFFYHKISRAVQWEMPVYPWESTETLYDDTEVYDYNQASDLPISHLEIEQMYVALNKQYELKQKRQQVKDQTRQEQKIRMKKSAFKSKISAVISEVLKPHKQSSCKVGRITSNSDFKYLVNKLSETIMNKELKSLGERPDWLRVTSLVEKKAETYVRTYIRSRGPVYVKQRKAASITQVDNNE